MWQEGSKVRVWGLVIIVVAIYYTPLVRLTPCLVSLDEEDVRSIGVELRELLEME